MLKKMKNCLFVTRRVLKSFTALTVVLISCVHLSSPAWANGGNGGGTGGNSGTFINAFGRSNGGNGGDGSIGVQLKASAATLTNNGTITGGTGGFGVWPSTLAVQRALAALAARASLGLAATRSTTSAPFPEAAAEGVRVGLA
jgi:hypothetical protein